MIEQKTLELRTRGRGTTEITAEVARPLVVVALLGDAWRRRGKLPRRRAVF